VTVRRADRQWTACRRSSAAGPDAEGAVTQARDAGRTDGGGLAVPVTAARVSAASAASRARDGSFWPFARGRPRRAVRAGGSSYGAASLRSRIVQVMPGGIPSALSLDHQLG
jgi:hypothetical protein